MSSRRKPTGLLRSVLLPLLLATTAISSCRTTQTVESFEPLPASYTGTLPCADCEGITVLLTLESVGLFTLRTQYLGRPGVFDRHGKWTQENGIVRVSGGEAEELMFRVVEEGLQKLSIDGQPIRSQHNYTLTRSPSVIPIEPSLERIGKFVYAADAALFTDCITQQRWPVAQEADYLALERAYLAARQVDFEQLLVVVEARLVNRPSADPSVHTHRQTLIVDRFIRLDPDGICSK